MVTAIAAAGAGSDPVQLDIAIDRFEREALRFGIDVVPGMVADDLAERLHEAWHRGWQPSDLQCVLRKRAEEPALDLVSLAIAHEARDWVDLEVPATWQRQLAELEDSRVRPLQAAGFDRPVTWLSGTRRDGPEGRRAALSTGLKVLVVLSRITNIALLEPEPCSWPKITSSSRRARRSNTSMIDPTLLTKIRALLTKAESTTFEPEAMALTAKAQSLIAKHSIDAAVLAASDQRSADEPEQRRLPVDDPYALEKAGLLATITTANRSRTIWSKEMGFATVIGFEPDLDAVELLYTSLLVQATTAMVAAGSQHDRSGRSRTRSFRQSFLVGYSDRIGQRLAEAADGAVRSSEAETGGSILPALVARDEQVDAATEDAFPEVRTVRNRVNNQSGYIAGQLAAAQAQLGPDTALES